MRRDCDVRMELLDPSWPTARTADDFVDRLVVSLEAMLREDPDFVTLIFELFTLSRRNEEIAAEFAELLRRTREHVGELLRPRSPRACCTCAPTRRRWPTSCSRWRTGSRCACSPTPRTTTGHDPGRRGLRAALLDGRA